MKGIKLKHNRTLHN